jgi:hypothetical protein
MNNGKPQNGIDAQRLAGQKPDKVRQEIVFPVATLDDVLASIRRAGGTGELKINFRNGQARGEAKWAGVVKE